MALTGDFSKLAQLRQKVERVVDVSARIAAPAAAVLSPLFQGELRAGVDAYGRAFKPTRRGNQPLWRTGAAAASMSVQPSGLKLRAIIGAPYMIFNLSTRNPFPKPSIGVPTAWRIAIADEARKAFAEHFR